MRYKQREIVLVFPFSDLRTVKRRPVLILSNNDYNDNFKDVLVCVITSNRFSDEYLVDLNDSDLEMVFLPEPSVIKVHKLFTIHKNRIVKKFSLMKIEVFQKNYLWHEVHCNFICKNSLTNKRAILTFRPKTYSIKQKPSK